VLTVDVTRSGSRHVLVDHGDGVLVALVEDRGTGLGKTEIRKNGAKVLGGLGGGDGYDELGFGRGRRDSSRSRRRRRASGERMVCRMVGV
jgi:hypothetical protein